MVETTKLMSEPDGQPTFQTRERRVWVYWVPEDLVASACWTFGRLMTAESHRSLPLVLSLPQIAGVPSDAVLEQVRHSWDRRAFGFLFSHPSFPVVPDGEELRGSTAVLAYRTVTLPASVPAWNDMEDLH